MEKEEEMDNKKNIYRRLAKLYPRAATALYFRNPWQMLVATILSAQCTDKRVNEITKILFKDYPDLSDYLNMEQNKLIGYIRSAGFFNNKSKNILLAARVISEKFNGKVPKTMAQMLLIPGVARKTANVVLGNAYNVVEGIAVDTHVKRLSFRLGFSTHTNPDMIEQDLMNIFPKNSWMDVTYVLIEHGRAICKAGKPSCSGCVLFKDCPRKGISEYS